MSEHIHHDPVGSRFGMWLFLFTELLLFGGLFILYAVYLNRYPHEFAHAAKELSTPFGAANTLVLLTSSLSVALAVTMLQLERNAACKALIGATVLLALVFLVNKFFEWQAKFSHGIFPGQSGLAELAPGESVFFGLYYLTTGLHGLHVLIGAALLSWALWSVNKADSPERQVVLLENSGLYWHLVDLIWIFIFPLYYLLL